jgi:hypothetical protein
MLVVGEQRVDFELECRAALRQPSEVAEYLSQAVVGAAQGVWPRKWYVMSSAHATKRRKDALAYAWYPRKGGLPGPRTAAAGGRPPGRP